MENVESNKKKRLMWLLVFAWVIAAGLGGCVISLNIQKNNSNSEQKVDQNASANQENDSTNFNFKMKQHERRTKRRAGNTQKHILDGLQFSPVQVDVERYSFNNKGYIINTQTGFYHEVLIFDFEEDECWWVFDSETNQVLKFDWNYNFGSPMIHSLKKKNMTKIYKKKGQPALYFLNPKDEKLVSFSDGVISGGELFKTLFAEYYFDEYDELPYPIADYSIKTV